MTERDYQRNINRLAQHLTAAREDQATLRQELIRAYFMIVNLRKALEDDGK